MSFCFVFVLVFVHFSLFFLRVFRFVPGFLFVSHLFVSFLISYFYHLLVVISKPLNTTFTLTPSKFCVSSDYYLWNNNCNCFRLPWIKFSVVGSLFFFVNQHSSPFHRLKSFMSYTQTQRHLLSLPTKWCSVYAGQLSLSLLFLHLHIIFVGQDCWQTCIFLWWSWRIFPFVTNLRKPGCETITSSWINWRAARFDDLSQWKQVDSASCLKEIQLMSVYTLYRRFLIFGILASIHRCYGFTSELVTCPNVIKLCLFSWFLKLEYADYKVLDSTVFTRV